jgi:methionine synthase I (cobalamin-dependent)
MHPLIQELLAAKPVVTDGAWGTELQKRGLPIGACPDAWNLSHPGEVEAVARAYVAAGSRVLLTNTFGANRIALSRHGLEERVVEINRAGVTLSRRAIEGRAHVFASMGPSGAMLMAGEITEEGARAAFLEQARSVAEAGAEGIVIETMTDLTEATIALAAAQETGLPVIVCMVFGAGRTKDRTMMGVTAGQAAAALIAAGADGIGANCGEGAASLTPATEQLRIAATRLAGPEFPLWIKPNLGLPELVDGAAVYGTQADAWAAEAAALTRAGADFIGGCCGAGPGFIRALVERLATEYPRDAWVTGAKQT